MNEEHALLAQEGYDPNRLLDAIIERMKLKNDAALSRMLEVAPPVISKIRHRRLPIGASMLIRMHETTDLTIRELRDLMGDRRQKYRVSDAYGKPQGPEKSDGQDAAPAQQSPSSSSSSS